MEHLELGLPLGHHVASFWALWPPDSPVCHVLCWALLVAGSPCPVVSRPFAATEIEARGRITVELISVAHWKCRAWS